jgi:hypothetical protein
VRASIGTLVRGAGIILVALAAAGCANVPAPKYQPAIGNTEVLIGEPAKIAVGTFTAAPGVPNRELSMRGANSIKGGGTDGTFSGYLHDAALVELQTAGRYDPHSDLLLTGVLTRNTLITGISEGSATVAARFTLLRDGRACLAKTLIARSQWPSSFLGAVAIPAAINNYPSAYQQLLGKLFTDPQFKGALEPKTAGMPGR